MTTETDKSLAPEGQRMNRCEAIRALMNRVGQPLNPSQVIAGLPDYPAKGLREAIGLMKRAKILDRTGNRSDGYAYFVTRAVKLKRYATDEERKAGKILTDAAWNLARKRVRPPRLRKPRVRTADETLAKQRALKEAARVLKEQDRAEEQHKRQREAEATRAATAAKRRERSERLAKERAAKRSRQSRTKAQRLMAHGTAAPVRVKAALPETQPKVRKARSETVEEWMRRTKQEPDVLPVAWNIRKFG